MGFTTGFTGGVTVTLGLAYLTVLAHERNRQSQALYLRSQTSLLTSLLDPNPPPPTPSKAEIARTSRESVVENAKDRWNDEIENAVRWVQNTDWNGVREGMEGAVSRLLGGGLQKSREGIDEAEKQARPKVQEAVDRSKAAASSAKEEAARGLNRAAAGTIAAVEQVPGVASKGVQKGSSAVDLARTEATGTIESVKGAISSGIEKGKEMIGLATAKVEEKAKSASLGMSAQEKALRQRYEKSPELTKSVEEVLAERYTPIDKRDNSVLRGV